MGNPGCAEPPACSPGAKSEMNVLASQFGSLCLVLLTGGYLLLGMARYSFTVAGEVEGLALPGYYSRTGRGFVKAGLLVSTVGVLLLLVYAIGEWWALGAPPFGSEMTTLAQFTRATLVVAGVEALAMHLLLSAAEQNRLVPGAVWVRGYPDQYTAVGRRCQRGFLVSLWLLVATFMAHHLVYALAALGIVPLT